MKKNDMAVIVLIVSISLVVSFFVVKSVFGEPKKANVKVEVVEPISADIVQPSNIVFNKDAINPTVVIQIGNPANKQPFVGN
jgi:hypothetical protein